jgi:hypothetical protein
MAPASCPWRPTSWFRGTQILGAMAMTQMLAGLATVAIRAAGTGRRADQRRGVGDEQVHGVAAAQERIRSGADPDGQGGHVNRGLGAAAGRLLAQLLPAAVGRRDGQADGGVAARPVRAQAEWSAGVRGTHAAAGLRFWMRR